jgi:sterol desaturase/sphingolipid hydroxylase (fatty acid hydroxylase superfamily)
MLDLTSLPGILALPFRSLFGWGSPYGLPSLIGALLFTLGFYLVHRLRRGQKIGPADFVRTIFPRELIFSASSRLDMRMWLVNGLVLSVVYGVVSIGAVMCSHATQTGLVGLFGPLTPIAWPGFVVMALATVSGLLAYELAYWFGHYLFHRYAFLWEFHKVHHSAEQMTVFTELRQHPVEILAFINVIALFTGVTLGALTYLFGPGAQPFTLLNGNLLLMAFLLTWGHLRHSHMWISYRGLAGRLFQSPAHHQLHHSDNPAHWDKNLGFSLAVWDWLFGTLYIPAARREDITFGVGAENDDYRSVADNFIRPFVKSWRHLVGAARPAPEARPTGEAI